MRGDENAHQTHTALCDAVLNARLRVKYQVLRESQRSWFSLLPVVVLLKTSTTLCLKSSAGLKWRIRYCLTWCHSRKYSSNKTGFTSKPPQRAVFLSWTITYTKKQKRKTTSKSVKQLGGREAAWVVRWQSQGWEPLRNSLWLGRRAGGGDWLKYLCIKKHCSDCLLTRGSGGRKEGREKCLKDTQQSGGTALIKYSQQIYITTSWHY